MKFLNRGFARRSCAEPANHRRGAIATWGSPTCHPEEEALLLTWGSFDVIILLWLLKKAIKIPPHLVRSEWQKVFVLRPFFVILNGIVIAKIATWGSTNPVILNGIVTVSKACWWNSLIEAFRDEHSVYKANPKTTVEEEALLLTWGSLSKLLEI